MSRGEFNTLAGPSSCDTSLRHRGGAGENGGGLVDNIVTKNEPDQGLLERRRRGRSPPREAEHAELYKEENIESVFGFQSRGRSQYQR